MNLIDILYSFSLTYFFNLFFLFTTFLLNSNELKFLRNDKEMDQIFFSTKGYEVDTV